ncbi:MAG TPA: NAD(P)H-hydrate dehydratase [Nocardioidaceae bacterium]|nr:NAD(P)H-hydrate dehydratase [Nocardioidaceae bacterium]
MSGAEPTVVTPATLRSWPLPEPGSDKSARGRIAVVGGTVGTPGAVLLAGEAALRAGAGKLTVAAPGPVAVTLAVAMPEALVVGLPVSPGGSISVSAVGELVSFAQGAEAVLVGPGFGDPEECVLLLEELVPKLRGPLVVDALASAYLTEHPDGLRHLEGRVVLTVNPTELARTAGWDEDKVEDSPYDAARDVARRSQVVVLCGGEEKLVVTPDGSSWVVQGGGHGLGVSGSGDVNAGIVAGLLARGAEPSQAAVWGGYLHARSGERLASSVGAVGYLAREIPRQVPPVLAELA